MEALKTKRALTNAVTEEDSENAFVSRQYVKGTHALKPYMRCTRALLALASRIDEFELTWGQCTTGFDDTDIIRALGHKPS